MKAFRILIVLASSVVLGVESQNSDIFNYYSANKNENGITSRGQPNWDQVRCANTDICVSSGKVEQGCLATRYNGI